MKFIVTLIISFGLGVWTAKTLAATKAVNNDGSVKISNKSNVVSCFDFCSNAYIEVKGNTCSRIWDNACWRAVGSFQKEQPSNSESCGKAEVPCWNPCTHSYELLAGNTCKTEWNDTKGCFTAKSFCDPLKAIRDDLLDVQDRQKESN